MTLAVARSPFNRSPLIRLLAAWQAGPAPAGGAALAERVSQWLTVTDAITLATALGTARKASTATTPADPVPMHHAFTHLRGDLAQRIVDQAERLRRQARLKCAQPAPEQLLPREPDDGFSPYHRAHLALQRDMDARIVSLRVDVRGVLATRSATLRQVAALDVTLEKAWAARERTLLMGLPRQLEQRYRQRCAAAARPDDWEITFCTDWQQLLEAELDLRFRPVAGLIEALGNEISRSS